MHCSLPVARLADRGPTGPRSASPARDYALTAKVIEDGTPELPSLRDPDGAEILRRMVDPEHLTALEESRVPIGVRLQRHAILLTAVRRILSAYVDAAENRSLEFHADVAELLAFTLRGTVVGMCRTKELAERIPGSAERVTYQDGLREMKASIVKVIGTVETSLSDPFFRMEDRSLFLRTMVEVIPDAVTAFPASDLGRFREKLVGRLGEFPGAADQAALQTMIAAIDRAASSHDDVLKYQRQVVTPETVSAGSRNQSR